MQNYIVEVIDELEERASDIELELAGGDVSSNTSKAFYKTDEERDRIVKSLGIYNSNLNRITRTL